MDVAVIGHGPSPEGRGWGRKIDACDAVVRMWQCGWQTPEDYGTRYDYGVLNVGGKSGRWAQEELGAGQHPLPDVWLVNYLPNVEVPESVCGRPCIVGPSDEIRERLVKEGGHTIDGRFVNTTRGLFGLVAASEILKPKRLIAVGFDYVTSGAIKGRQYPDCHGPPRVVSENDGVRNRAHDFTAERAIFLSLSAIRAEEVW